MEISWTRIFLGVAIFITALIWSLGAFGVETKMIEEMLYTVVRIGVPATDANGSGVVVKSEKGVTTIITANHIATKDWLDVKFYPSHSIVRGRVTRKDVGRDLAVVEVLYPHRFVAKISTKKLHPFDQVFAVGAATGFDPLPTLGIVEGYDKERGRIRASPPMAEGSSGGGLFTFDYESWSWVLVGISSGVGMKSISIKTMFGTENIYIPYVQFGYHIPVSDVVDFIIETTPLLK